MNILDKYELTIKIEKLDKLVKSGDYVNAAKVAEQLEWKKMKQWTVMSNAIEAYVATGKYDKARNVCIYAYNRKLGGRRLLATLMEMYVKLGELDDAEEIYQEYVELAPRDVTGYILLYKLKRAKKAPVEELITILQNYKDKELDEEYEYELALLYSEAGLTDKCVRECDELVLWFADGIYVEKALRLKQMYVPLTPGQMEKLARLEKLSSLGINSSAVYDGMGGEPAQTEAAATEAEPDTAYGYDDHAYNNHGYDTDNAGAYDNGEYDTRDISAYEQHEYDTHDTRQDYNMSYEPTAEEAEDYDNEALYALDEEQEQHEQHEQQKPGIVEEPVSHEAEPEEPEAYANETDSADEENKPVYIDDIGNTTEWSPIDIDNAISAQPEPEKEVKPQPLEKKPAKTAIKEDMQKLEPDYDISIKVPDYSVYDTRNVQQELKANVNEIMEAYKNRERTEALREAAQLEDIQDDSEPTKEIIINKHQWRKASRNAAKTHDDNGKKASPGSTVSDSRLPDINSLKNADIREVTQQLTLEQMSELVAQLQAEQERRRREAAADREANSSQMDITQWLSDLDDEDDEKQPDNRATREIPVAEIKKMVMPVKSEEEQAEAPQQHTQDRRREPAQTEQKADDYSKEEREALERTVREIAASINPDEKPKAESDKQEPEAEEEEFEEIPDIDDSESIEEENDVNDEADETGGVPDLEHAINAGIERIIEDNAKAAVGVSDSGRYLLKDEERVFLDRYLYMSGMEKRLCRYIGAKRAEAVGKLDNAGHVAIMGSRTTDKTAFAINLFKALHAYDEDREQKLARISAEKINEKGYELYADKLAGQTLVIENAGRLKRETLISMLKLSRNTLFIIMDEEFEINKLFADNPDLADNFTGCFLLKQYTVNELVDIAKDYAESQGWRVEDKALLKLYLILSQVPNDDQGNAVELVKEIMNHAAGHAKNRLGNKLFGRFRSVLTIKEGDLSSENEYEDDEDEENTEAGEDTQPDDSIENDRDKPKKEKKSRVWKKNTQAEKKASSDDTEDNNDYDEDDEDDEYDDDYDDDDDYDE